MKNSLVKNPPVRPADGSVPEMPEPPGAPPGFRRLDRDELVRIGDFVKDGRRGFEPWEGPSGFRAHAFVKAIYRRHAAPVPGAGKTS